MIAGITELCLSDLRSLAFSMQAGRLTPPFTPLALQRVLPRAAAEQAAHALNALISSGISAGALPNVLELLIADRQKNVAIDDLIDLVTSGPDVAGQPNRDTSVVVRDLFAYAKKSVWIAGYAVFNGRRVFEALAERMASEPNLQVRLILDIRRGPGDTSTDTDLVYRFKDRFRKRDWPANAALPSAYYFPKAMDTDPSSRGSLHAKCIVIDGETCFVSSANFTEAAQKKNIEVGLLVRSEGWRHDFRIS